MVWIYDGGGREGGEGEREKEGEGEGRDGRERERTDEKQLLFPRWLTCSFSLICK